MLTIKYKALLLPTTLQLYSCTLGRTYVTATLLSTKKLLTIKGQLLTIKGDVIKVVLGSLDLLGVLL